MKAIASYALVWAVTAAFNQMPALPWRNAQNKQAPTQETGSSIPVFVQAAEVLNRIECRNAEIAWITGEYGTVAVQASFDSRGRVIDTKAVRRVVGQDDAAQEAVRQWRFKPVVREGNAVPATTVVNVRCEPAVVGSNGRVFSMEAIRRIFAASANSAGVLFFRDGAGEIYFAAVRKTSNGPWTVSTREPDLNMKVFKVFREDLARLAAQHNGAEEILIKKFPGFQLATTDYGFTIASFLAAADAARSIDAY